MMEKLKEPFTGEEAFDIAVGDTQIIKIEGISRLSQLLLFAGVATLTLTLLFGAIALFVLFFDNLYASLGFEKTVAFLLFIYVIDEVTG